MPDAKQHDPLDPLEAAYEVTEKSEPPIPENEIFHGEPISQPPPAAAPPAGGAPPPPLATPPPRQAIKLLLLVGGGLLIALLIYSAYRFLRGKQTGKAANLVYWMLWEEEETLRPLFEAYRRAHPQITVKIVRQTPIQYRERLQAHIARAEGPDIFRFHNTWVPMLREELAPLPAEIISADEYVKRFYPVMRDDLHLGKNIVGIPLMYDGLVVFYNTEILAAAGYNAPAADWSNFLLQAQELTVKDYNGKIVTAGAALGRADNIEHFSDILGLLILQNGGNPARPAGEAGTGALKFFRLFAQRPDNVWSAAFENDITAFANGKVAMIFAPTWEIFTVQAINPQLNFRTAPVPQVEGAQQPVGWASYWAEGVNSRSSKQKAAWELLAFLTRKENLEKFYTQAARTRLVGEPFPRKDMAAGLANDRYLGALLKQAENAQSFYLASRTFDNGINDRIISYFKDAVNSLDAGNSPEAALETAAAGVAQVLQTYNVKVE